MNDRVNHPKHYASHPSGVECEEGDQFDRVVEDTIAALEESLQS